MLLLLALFLLLTSFYVLKTAREGIVLASTTFRLQGDEVKTYASGAMALLLVVLVPAYDMLANRLRRIALVNISIAFVVISLAGFYVAAHAGVSIGLAFYVWLGVVSVFLIAQFWSFANDFYSEEQGKRVFAMIALGGSMGAIAGPRLAQIATTRDLMLLSPILLFAYAMLINIVDRCDDHQRHERIVKEVDADAGGFALVLRDPYLALIAVLLLILSLVNTTGDYILSNAVLERAMQIAPDPHATAERSELIKTFYGDFFFHVNLVAFALQAAFVSRVIRKLGVGRALFVLPVIVLGAYGSVAMLGTFAVVRAAKLTEGSTDYSLHNTVRQMLFLPVTRAAKYKAKAAIDTFFVRFGDTLSAVLVAVAIHALAFGRRALAIVNVALVAVWLVICVAIARRHQALTHRPLIAGELG
ncbi:MAG TPA: Npt1/Npt2 family nucleotide transporter [Kofleriaceae bacterium]|nr:Npt1/Npt2 family nucleotide transporter [Kofleriaceae bacterium]